jgi:fructan beta-fructosidase
MQTALKVILAVALGFYSVAAHAEEDILLADFESATYGDWQVTGEAFGPGPAVGTLPGQMPVTGFVGHRLVNSFFHGDGSTGVLASPSFPIARPYLVFYIGGGGHAGETCMNLLVAGDVVRTATGTNTAPGGSEELMLAFWDVSEFLGKMARIEIVDHHSGGWGHINVDHILLSDSKPDIPTYLKQQVRDFTVAKRYLLFPIQTGARKANIDLSVDGVNVREFDAEIASTAETTDFWSFLDLSEFQGQLVTLTAKNASDRGFELIVQSDDVPGLGDFYSEPMRPQFHFSQMLGWNNDPNGMVYYDGEWHLFFQHNPYGWRWGNMHWGHAVSKDLVHWQQLPIAIYNKQRGDWAFSGGAVVDEHNTAGWQTGSEKVIVASWTSTGRGECIAYSNDRGRTFVEYEGNPVVRHQGRDPKIIWYEPGKHWVMAVYDEIDDQRTIAFYTSKDLKQWSLQSRLEGYYECPELFQLPIDGEKANSRWVILAADAQYALGQFDGKTFTPEHAGKQRLHYGAYYASQTFSNAPEGRRIQIGWAQIEMPGMPFNQTFSFPHELTLRTTQEGPRLFAEPVPEIENIYGQRHEHGPVELRPTESLELPVSQPLLDIQATFDLGNATSVGLEFGDEKVVYDAQARSLDGAPLQTTDGKLKVRVLVDRPMLEIIGNQGRVYITKARKSTTPAESIRVFALGGRAKLLDLEVHELKSIW